MAYPIRATSLEGFITCPYKFKYAPDADPDKGCFLFGKALHLLVEMAVMCVENEMAENIILSKFTDKEQRVLMRMRDAFMEHLSEKNYEFVMSERSMTHRFENDVILEGTFDLLFYDSDKDEYVIVDIKTASKAWDEDHISQVNQCKIYPALMDLTAGFKVSRFEYWIMKKILKTSVQEVVYNVPEDNTEQVKEFVNDYWYAEDTLDFPKKYKNHTCFFCPFIKQCRAENENNKCGDSDAEDGSFGEEI